MTTWVSCDQDNFPFLSPKVHKAIALGLRQARHEYSLVASRNAIVGRHSMPKYRTFAKRDWDTCYLSEHFGDCENVGKLERSGERYFIVDKHYCLILRKARSIDPLILETPAFTRSNYALLYMKPLIPLGENEEVKYRLEGLEPYFLVNVPDRTGNRKFYLADMRGQEPKAALIDVDADSFFGGDAYTSPDVPDVPSAPSDFEPKIKLKPGVKPLRSNSDKVDNK